MLRSVRVSWKNTEKSIDYTPHVRALGWGILILIALSAVVSFVRLHYVLSQVVPLR
jgi:hypothetical protein